MLTKAEINRKALHLVALAMPAGIFYLPKMAAISKWTPPAALAVLFFLSLALDTLRLLFPSVQNAYRVCFGSLMRHTEAHKTTGATYIIGGAFLCSVVFVDTPAVSFISLVLFILGDAVAAIVGLGIGRIKLFGKSLEGFMACLGLCLTLFAVLFPNMPDLLDHFGGRLPFPVMIITSVSVAVLELIPIKIKKTTVLDDNLYVPVLSGLILQSLLPFF